MIVIWFYCHSRQITIVQAISSDIVPYIYTKSYLIENALKL